MTTIVPLPIFEDNYIWLIEDGHNALVIDPGLAAPVLDYLHKHLLNLAGILITHRHLDHIGGITALCQATNAPVYLPKHCTTTENAHLISENDTLIFEDLKLTFQVLETPGHTSEHISFYCEALGALFCGDTLFSAGCGRINDGPPLHLYQSLQRIKQLPANTQIYCSHEYTLANLRFALEVEPSNTALYAHKTYCQQLRAKNTPTLPTNLKFELTINPFLRLSTEIKNNIHIHFSINSPLSSDAEYFAALRRWKDHF